MKDNFTQRQQNEMLQAKPNAGNLNQTSSGGRGGSSSKRKAVKKRNLFLPAILVVMGCAVFLFAAWSAVRSPVLASILGSSPVVQAPKVSFARVEIPKPASQSQPIVQVVDIASPTITIAPSLTPTTELSVANVVITNSPTLQVISSPTNVVVVPTIQSDSQIVEATGVAIAEIVQDTPTSEYVAPTTEPYLPPATAGNDGTHWIDVDLSEQRVYAYAGDTLMNSFLVSTGTWQTPTVTGKFKVWIKVRSQAMSGPGYYLPDVPYVMFFYKGYGLHGTYWHNNFGTPISHGCVNLTVPDSEWLYNFSAVGTVVNVHY